MVSCVFIILQSLKEITKILNQQYMFRYIILLTAFLTLTSSNIYAAWKDVPIGQADPRFTMKVQKNWGVGSEEYRFYVHNNTSTEYRLVVEVTLNLACVGTKNFTLGINRVVYLPPNGDFNAFKHDWVHIYTSGADNFRDCRLKDGDSWTLYQGMSYRIVSIENLTAKKAEEARKKEEAKKAAEAKRVEEAKKAAEEKAAEEKRAAEQKAAEEKRAAEQKAAEEKRAADQRTAEEKRAADQKAAEEKKTAEAERREQQQNQGTSSGASRSSSENTSSSGGRASASESYEVDYKAQQEALAAYRENKAREAKEAEEERKKKALEEYNRRIEEMRRQEEERRRRTEEFNAHVNMLTQRLMSGPKTTNVNTENFTARQYDQLIQQNKIRNQENAMILTQSIGTVAGHIINKSTNTLDFEKSMATSVAVIADIIEQRRQEKELRRRFWTAEEKNYNIVYKSVSSAKSQSYSGAVEAISGADENYFLSNYDYYYCLQSTLKKKHEYYEHNVMKLGYSLSNMEGWLNVERYSCSKPNQTKPNTPQEKITDYYAYFLALSKRKYSHFQSRNWTDMKGKAVEFSQKAIEAGPRKYEAYEWAATIEDDPSKALDHMHKAIYLKPSDPALYRKRINLYFALKDYEGAVMDYDWLEKNDKLTGKENFYRGLCYKESTFWGFAEKDFRTAIEKKYDLPVVHSWLVYSQVQIEDYQNAILSARNYYKQHELNYTEPNDLYLIYPSLLRIGDVKLLEEFSTVFNQMAKDHPDHEKQKPVYKGNVAVLKENFSEAATQFQKYLTETSDSSYYIHQSALALMGSKNYEEAVPLIHRFNSVYKNFLLGKCYYEMGNYEAAIAYFRLASNETDLPLNDLYISRSALHQENYLVAIEASSQAIKKDSTLSEAYSNRGLASKNLHRHQDAIDDFNRALACPNPGSNTNIAELHFQKGITNFYEQNYDSASVSFDRALSYHSNEDRYLGFRYISYLHSDTVKAAESINKIQRRQSNAQLNYPLACYYAHKNQPEQAVKHLEAAFKNGYSDFKEMDNNHVINKLYDDYYYNLLVDEYRYKGDNPVFRVFVLPKHVSCKNGEDGAADVKVLGGKQPFSYDWSTANGAGEKGASFTAGTYSVEVEDFLGQVIKREFSITEPEQLAAKFDIRSANGNKRNGKIVPAISGGVPPYTFKWSDGSEKQVLKKTAPGDYVLVTTDKNNCIITDTVTVGITIGKPLPNLDDEAEEDDAAVDEKGNRHYNTVSEAIVSVQENGKALLEKKDYKGAVKTFKKAVKLQPDNELSLYLLADSYHQSKKTKPTHKTLDQLLAVNPKHHSGLYLKAIILEQEQEKVQAVATYDQLLAQTPEFSPALKRRAVLNTQLGENEKAVADYTSLLELETTGLDTLYFNRGLLHQELNSFKNAEADFTFCMEENQNFLLAYYHRGLVYLEMDKVSAAGLDFAKARELGLDPAKMGNLQTIAANFFEKGKASFATIQLDSANTYFSNAIFVKPDYHESYYWRGRTSYEKKEYEAAITDFNIAVNLHPQYFEAYFEKGNSFYALNMPDSAIVAYANCTAINAEHHLAYNRKGENEYILKNYEESVTDFTAAIKINKKVALYHYNQGRSLYFIGRYNESVDAESKAVSLDKKYTEAYYYRGLSYQGKQKYKDAVKDFSSAISNNEKYFEAWYEKGATLYLLTEYEDAAHALTNALALDSLSAQSYYFRGQCNRMLKKKEAAISDYETLGKLDTSSFNSVKYWIELGYLYLETGNMEESTISFNEALELEDTNAEGWLGLALIYASTDKKDECFQALRIALKNNKSLKKSISKNKAFKKYKKDNEFKAVLKMKG